MIVSGDKSTNKLDFIARQLAGLMEEHSMEDALATLEKECLPDYSAEMKAFRGMLEGAESGKAVFEASAFKTLNTLMPAVAPEAMSTLLRAYNDYLQRSKVIFRTYWAGVASLIGYLAVISVLALMLGFLFVVWILPEVGSVYESHGAALPFLTQAFFSFGDLGMPLLAILLLALVGMMAWFAHRFRRRIQKLAPLPTWPAWVPVFGPIAKSYNLGLFLNCARMLRKCGVAKEEAITAAARASHQADDLSLAQLNQGSSPATGKELAELGIATRLGNFDQELDHQCERHVGTLTALLVAGRERLALYLKLLVYAVVAVLVIAIYLPIFDMASVI